MLKRQSTSSQEITCNDPPPLNLHPLIVTTDVEGTITGVNDSFVKVFCFTRNELIGQELSCLVHSDMPSAFITSMQAAIAAGTAWRGIIKYRCKAGDFYWSDTYIMPLMKDGQVSSIRSVLFHPQDTVKQRAETLYQSWPAHQSRLFLWRKKSGLCQKLLALAGLPIGGLTLLALLQSDWLQALITLSLGILGMGFGWRMFGDLRQLCRSARHTLDQPLLCYLYTGGMNEICIIRHALGLRSAELRALAACMSQTHEALRYAKTRSDHFMAQANLAARNQSKEARAIYQAMRSILEDQHHTTAAATRTQQLIFDSQNNSLQGREKLKRLVQTHRHQLQTLEQARQHLGNLGQRSKRIGGIIDRINEATEETHFSVHNAAGTDRTQTDLSRITKDVQQLAESTRNSVNEIRPVIIGLTHSTHTAVTAIEAGVQASSQIIALARDADHVLQTIISQVNRINSLALEVSNAMHHQSVTRATANYRLEALQENAVNAIQANRQVSYQAEKLEQQIEELQNLAHYFSRAIEQARGNLRQSIHINR